MYILNLLFPYLDFRFAIVENLGYKIISSESNTCNKELTMAEIKKYIAVDLGAESGRVMLGSVSERKLVLEEITRHRMEA